MQDAHGMTKEDRNNGMLCHILSFCGYVVPVGHIIGPLVFWSMKKEESEFVDYHGREALNFQISMTIWMVLCIPLCFVIIGVPMLIGLALADLILTIIAAIRASEGVYYAYPMTVRFVR